MTYNLLAIAQRCGTTTAPLKEPVGCIVWYDAGAQQWAEALLLDSPPHRAACPKCARETRTIHEGPHDDVHQRFLGGVSHRGICCVLDHPALLPTVGKPPVATPYVLTLSHHGYTSRKTILDEVAAYSAARSLYEGFTTAFDHAAAMVGGVGRTVASSPQRLVFSALTGVFAAEPDTVALRRADACDWNEARGRWSADPGPQQRPRGATRAARELAAAFLHHSWAVGSAQRCLCEVSMCVGSTVVTVSVHTNTSLSPSEAPFGPHCNGQRSAVARLINEHRCNAICRQLSLPPLAPLI